MWYLFLIAGRFVAAKVPAPTFFGRIMARLHGVKIVSGPHANPPSV